MALKTVGLLALMTHAGLPVPASEAEFPLFDQVLADIGDHQSIRGKPQLVFGAHRGAARRCWSAPRRIRWCWWMSWGARRIPEEGGALGVAVLEAFQRSRRVHAGVHASDGDEGVWGVDARACATARMGFDEETLEPTYVLRLGAPGKVGGAWILRAAWDWIPR